MDENREKSLWIHCPICGGKTRTKVYEDTVLVKFPLYCPKCKHETLIRYNGRNSNHQRARRIDAEPMNL